MKIAFPMRIDAYDKPGGDLVQVQAYIDAGKVSGAAGGPSFFGEIITDLHTDFSTFDIVHLTNLDRSIELFAYYLAARLASKPIVFSTIHHSYREIQHYEREGRHGVVGAASGLLSFGQLEALRGIVRLASYPQLREVTWSALQKGLRHTQISVLNNADLLLVLTSKEQSDICADFPEIRHHRFALLRNGYEPDQSTHRTERDGTRDIDVCVVGRIEARKNQLKILEALESLNLSGVFIGNENPNHKAYCRSFRSRLSTSCSRYLGGLSHSEVTEYLYRSKVHISASWFEVSSLVDLEAYLCGCRVVSSACGGTKELLGDNINYVNPSDLTDIVNGITSALSRALSPGFPAQSIGQLELQTWRDVGLQLSMIYRQVLEADRLPEEAPQISAVRD